MKYKVIITGSTGMVGKGVLIECLECDLIESNNLGIHNILQGNDLINTCE